MSHKKFGPDRFSRFDVYWIQTNRQTDRQAKFIYRLNVNKKLIITIDKIGVFKGGYKIFTGCTQKKFPIHTKALIRPCSIIMLIIQTFLYIRVTHKGRDYKDDLNSSNMTISIGSVHGELGSI